METIPALVISSVVAIGAFCAGLRISQLPAGEPSARQQRLAQRRLLEIFDDRAARS